MKENIPTLACVGQLGDRKVTKLWHSDPGIGMELQRQNDSRIQLSGPIRIYTTPSRQCFHVLTDAADSNSGGVVVNGSRRLDPGRDDLQNK